MRQIDQVRVATLNRGWSTPWEIQVWIRERWGVRLADASITARLRELREEGLEVPKRKRAGGSSWEYAITITDDVAGCRILWTEGIVEVGAALRTYRGTPREDTQPDLFAGAEPLADPDTEGRHPDGGRRR